MSETPNPLRLRKKHGSGQAVDVTAIDGERLVRAQSLRNAILASAIVILLFSLFWISFSEITNRVFPWFTVIQGFIIGHAARLVGRGTDWRFPVITAVLALLGALLANIAVSASVTAEDFGIGTFEVLRSVTSMTWPVFFSDVMTVADGFYAVIAAALAAFYTNRRLTRREYRALRLWREQPSQGQEQ